MTALETYDRASLTSLILSALVADDALTAAEIGALLGVPAADLRSALLELESAGAVVTSGRTSGMRYCLAVEEQASVAETAPVVAAARPRARRPRTARAPQQPATLDLLAALTETAELVLAGETLQTMRAISLDRRQPAVPG